MAVALGKGSAHIKEKNGGGVRGAGQVKWWRTDVEMGISARCLEERERKNRGTQHVSFLSA